MAIRGASYKRRALDFYATPKQTTQVILDALRFRKKLCDPCSGNGAMLRVFTANKYAAVGNDLRKGFDFIHDSFPKPWANCDIVTNPPYGDRRGTLALEFVVRALEVTKPWNGRVAMLLPIDFDSGKTRQTIFRDCPVFSHKLVLLDRIRWFRGQSGSTNHCWMIWDWKHEGPPTIGYASHNYT